MSSSALYLLDTNTVSYIVNGCSLSARDALSRFSKHHQITISTIVEGEILYGLARKPQATRIRAAFEAVRSVLEVLPWDSTAAHAYGTVRAQLASEGKSLSTIDTLIAAHAVSVDAILVTHDKTFQQVKSLRSVVDWATDLS